jgi:hypothetical protein
MENFEEDMLFRSLDCLKKELENQKKAINEFDEITKENEKFSQRELLIFEKTKKIINDLTIHSKTNVKITEELLNFYRQRNLNLKHFINSNIKLENLNSFHQTYLDHINTNYVNPQFEIRTLCISCNNMPKDCVISNGRRCDLYIQLRESDKCICKLDTAYSHCKQCLINYSMQKINEKLCTKSTEKLYCIIQCPVCGKKICPYDIYPVFINNKVYLENSENEMNNTFNIDNNQKTQSQVQRDFYTNLNQFVNVNQKKCTTCHKPGHKKNNCPHNLYYSPEFNNINSINTNNSIINNNNNNINNIDNLNMTHENLEDFSKNNFEYQRPDDLQNSDTHKRKKIDTPIFFDTIDAKTFFEE